MNNLKFIAGPPGTGKTHKYLTKKYKELLSKYKPENIILLSHTNVAADEIRDAVQNLPEIKKKDLDDKFFEYRICTIHSYCQSKLIKKSLFDDEDHQNLCREHKEFRFHDETVDEHDFYQFIKGAIGRGLTPKEYFLQLKESGDLEKKKYKDLKVIMKMREWFKEYKDREQVRAYEDMIEEFNNKNTKIPEIDVLIVDEAQDSNVPQRKALEKIATYAKEFIMIGDPDQTIFEWAGADAHYFHTISKDAEQLEEGLRCGKTINNLCKEIIAPIWKKYKYSRVWKPAEGIIGHHYHLASYRTDCSHLRILLDKIKNTKETFLFTFRGKPSGDWCRTFFQLHGIPFSHVGNDPFVSKKQFECHKFWPQFVKGKPFSLLQIKNFHYYMGSKAVVHGKGKKTFSFKGWVNREYTIDELIKEKIFKLESKTFTDFLDVRVRSEVKDDQVRFIKQLIRDNIDYDDQVRVQYGCIHKVKGLTFDNVIVDETCTRTEDYFTQLRLKYVAYSRGRIDCWTIRSQRQYTLGQRESSMPTYVYSSRGGRERAWLK